MWMCVTGIAVKGGDVYVGGFERQMTCFGML